MSGKERIEVELGRGELEGELSGWPPWWTAWDREVRQGAGENEGGIPQFPFDFDETNRLWANLKCTFERGEGNRKSPVVDRGPLKPDLSFSQEVKPLLDPPPPFEAKVHLSGHFLNFMDEGPCLI